MSQIIKYFRKRIKNIFDDETEQYKNISQLEEYDPAYQPQMFDDVLEFATDSFFPEFGAVNTLYISLASGFGYYWDGGKYCIMNGRFGLINGNYDGQILRWNEAGKYWERCLNIWAYNKAAKSGLYVRIVNPAEGDRVYDDIATFNGLNPTDRTARILYDSSFQSESLAGEGDSPIGADSDGKIKRIGIFDSSLTLTGGDMLTVWGTSEIHANLISLANLASATTLDDTDLLLIEKANGLRESIAGSVIKALGGGGGCNLFIVDDDDGLAALDKSEGYLAYQKDIDKYWRCHRSVTEGIWTQVTDGYNWTTPEKYLHAPYNVVATFRVTSGNPSSWQDMIQDFMGDIITDGWTPYESGQHYYDLIIDHCSLILFEFDNEIIYNYYFNLQVDPESELIWTLTNIT
jgi:hypothetical protein